MIHLLQTINIAFIMIFAFSNTMTACASRSLLSSDSSAVRSSIINCIGAWSNCTTSHDGQLSCKIRYAVNPFQSTICYVRNACLNDGHLELYDDSPLTKGFDGEELALSPFLRSHGSDPEREGGIIHINVLPLKEMPNNSSGMFSSIPGVLIENSDNHNFGHIYGDEIWPVFQMLHRYQFDWKSNDFQMILRRSSQ